MGLEVDSPVKSDDLEVPPKYTLPSSVVYRDLSSVEESKPPKMAGYCYLGSVQNPIVDLI